MDNLPDDVDWIMLRQTVKKELDRESNPLKSLVRADKHDARYASTSGIDTVLTAAIAYNAMGDSTSSAFQTDGTGFRNARGSPGAPKVCYNWIERGSCDRGDQCRYEHDAAKRGKTTESSSRPGAAHAATKEAPKKPISLKRIATPNGPPAKKKVTIGGRAYLVHDVDPDESEPEYVHEQPDEAEEQEEA